MTVFSEEEEEDESQDYIWDLFEKGEEYGEEYAEKGIKRIKDIAGDDIPLIKAGSLAMLAFGIRSYKELLFERVWQPTTTWPRTIRQVSMAP